MDVKRGPRSAWFPALFFYAGLGSGCWVFGGFRAAAVLILIVFVCNKILRLAGESFGLDGSAVFSLTVRSLLSLGLFPFVWLVCRIVPDGWLIPALGVILASGLALSLRRRTSAGGSLKRDYAAILFVFLVVIGTTRLPFSRIGYPVEGNYAYRAYFSSDYLKHFSVVESLNNGPVPPANLYFAGEPLHYYWLPYATPAVVARVTGTAPKALFAFSFAVNFLFLLLLFLTCRRISKTRRWMPYLAVPIVLAPSLEGFYLWAVRSRFSFSTYFAQGRAVNIDGLTRWLWNLPQIDTLLRSLLYTPQHLLSLAFVLLFLSFADEETERPWVLSVFVGLSLASSFFVGGILLLSQALHVLGREGARVLRRDLAPFAFLRDLCRHFLLPLFVIALSVAMRMISSGGNGIVIKPLSPRQVFILLGLNFGLLGVSGAWGLLAARFRSRGVLAILLGVSLILLLAVRIAGFESDVSLKAGLVIILALALLACRLGEVRGAGKFAVPLALLIIIPGALTAVLDIRNSADVRNARFTSYVRGDEMRMLEWIRANVPEGKVVQNFPRARTWNLSAIPAFAGRPMAVGDRMHGQIFQVRPELYERRLEALRIALSGLPASRDSLRRLGVDYLFWGEDESRFFKTDDPGSLPVVHREGRTVLYALGPE
jgi:hypothetical protein